MVTGAIRRARCSQGIAGLAARAWAARVAPAPLVSSKDGWRGSSRKYQKPDRSPGQGDGDKHKEGRAPGEDRDQAGHDQRGRRIADPRKGMGDALGKSPASPAASRRTSRAWPSENRRLRQYPAAAAPETARPCRLPAPSKPSRHKQSGRKGQACDAVPACRRLRRPRAEAGHRECRRRRKQIPGRCC